MGVLDGHHVCLLSESKTAVTASSKLTEGYVIPAQPAQHFFHLLKYETWLLIFFFLQRERNRMIAAFNLKMICYLAFLKSVKLSRLRVVSLHWFS